jgi:hydroxymethylbilane synthase
VAPLSHRPPDRLRLATRGSPLARRQTDLVATLLRQAAPGVQIEPLVVRTEGDRRPDAPLDQIGGQGVFVKEVQAAVLDGRADATVHSAKDLPSQTPPGLVLAAVPRRGDPRDVMVGRPLSQLPPGARVATGSARRRAQLAHLRPDLAFVEARGNMARRLARADDGSVDAVVTAAAALDRLDWSERAAEVLSPTILLPQVGQGALALECRGGDEAVEAVLRAVDEASAHRALDAERSFLAALGGSCAMPVAALATPEPESDAGALRLQGMLASGDGRVLVRTSLSGEDPVSLGRALVRHLVFDCGGAAIEGWPE